MNSIFVNNQMLDNNEYFIVIKSLGRIPEYVGDLKTMEDTRNSLWKRGIKAAVFRNTPNGITSAKVYAQD